MSLLTTKHYISVANNFVEQVKDTRNAYYTFVAKATPWANSSGGIDETKIVTAEDSVSQTEQNVYNELVYGKIISNTDVSLMVPRTDWQSNTVYARYDSADADLYTKNFFVVTNTYDVFKVIDNNGSAASTIKPSLTSNISTFMTGDGYIWKYLFTVDSAANSKFTSTSYIPVHTDASVSGNAVGGTVDAVIVTNGGVNYKAMGTGFLAAYVNNSSIQLPSTASSYDNFYTGSSIYLNSGFGSGQIRKIAEYSGASKKIITQTAFNTFTHIEVSNVQGTLAIGQLITQRVDNISVLFTNGYFNAADLIVQSNTGAVGSIVSANNTSMRVFRTNSADFQLDYPIRNLNDSGALMAGRVITANGSNVVTSYAAGFNALSSVNSAQDSIALTPPEAEFFANGDFIYYRVNSGNTAVTGLTANSNYYIVGANSTAVKLSLTKGGSAINVTATAISETGHSIYTALSNYYSVGNYIRVGTDANNDIHRVATVSNATLTTFTPVERTAVADSHYKLINVTTPVSITKSSANGYVSNLNLSSVKINVSNLLSVGVPFIVGEKVDLVDSANLSQGANGIIAYSNTTQVVLSVVNGPWTVGSDLYIRGNSSLQKANVDVVSSYPNLTLRDPIGTFSQGFPVLIGSVGNSVGNAFIQTFYNLPNSLTEYIITPTVAITGDGSNASAYAVVNSTSYSSNNIIKIQIINPGIGYTKASITITSNSNHGNGATGVASVSPVNGHGFAPAIELGARHVAISTTFDIPENELNVFPGYGKYRTFGILKNPKFRDVTVNLSTFDRVKLATSGTVGAFIPGEVVINAANSVSGLHSNAFGICVFSNSSVLELENVRGGFSNTVTALNKAYGVSSNSYANIASVKISHFSVTSNTAINQKISGATGKLVNVISNTQLSLTDVIGKLTTGDIIYDSGSNAYATVASIYIANGAKDVSSVFGNRFNQTLRFTLTSNSGAFVLHETVIQEVTLAEGNIINITGEKDLEYSIVTGTFSVGQEVVDLTTGANGRISSVNSSYMKVTTVSPSLSFSPGNYINNKSSANAQIVAVYPVIVLNNVGGINEFQAGSYDVIGQVSGSEGRVYENKLITFPMLVKDSGEVVYLKNVNAITKSATSQEQVKLIIKL